MSENPYANVANERVEVASEAEVEERLAFIRRTYLHLLGAIVALVGVEFALFQTNFPEYATNFMTQSSWSWLIVLGVFGAVGSVADWWARSSESTAMQYAGLGLYVGIESIILLPMLAMAEHQMTTLAGVEMPVILAAAIATLSVFSVLTGYVFVTKQDFSFLGPFLAIATVVALGVIVVSLLFGFHLGTIFAWLMVGLMAGYIVYYTSNVLHHYRTDQHVAASLALFSAIATLFWYILMLFMDE
jgi:FtsH-binding integral membrane protein